MAKLPIIRLQARKGKQVDKFCVEVKTQKGWEVFGVSPDEEDVTLKDALQFLLSLDTGEGVRLTIEPR